MCRILLATLAICLIAAPASAGKFVAIPEVNMGIEPAAKTSADCRIANSYTACGTVLWTLGGWCIDDEVAEFFDLANDPCLAGCSTTNGQVFIESAEVRMRAVGTTCTRGYPVTTFPMDVQFFIYALDPALSTPDCPVPAMDPVCQSTVHTVPAHTATGSTDPNRFWHELIPVGCCVDLQPLFGGLRFINFSVIESTYNGCGNGGVTACPWWYPGLLGRNGDIAQTPCAIPCTQYYRSISVYGPDWFESTDAGLDLTQMDYYLNASCQACGVGVKETTWGKIKSIMNN